jgi:hypothetical protein
MCGLLALSRRSTVIRGPNLGPPRLHWKNDPVTDWTTIATSGATAVGTMVLAAATFAAVRSGQRAARATEAALLAGVRPVLVPSRLEDATQKIRFVDDHWVHLEGGRAVLEATEEAVYLVIAVRNVGNGIAVLDRWNLSVDAGTHDRSVTDLDGFHRLTRDIYVPAGDQGFWQGALRDQTDPLFAEARVAIDARRPIVIDILYGDHEGGQRTISQFLLSPTEGGSWLVSVSRHWNIDRPDPR